MLVSPARALVLGDVASLALGSSRARGRRRPADGWSCWRRASRGLDRAWAAVAQRHGRRAAGAAQARSCGAGTSASGARAATAPRARAARGASGVGAAARRGRAGGGAGRWRRGRGDGRGQMTPRRTRRRRRAAGLPDAGHGALRGLRERRHRSEDLGAARDDGHVAHRRRDARPRRRARAARQDGRGRAGHGADHRRRDVPRQEQHVLHARLLLLQPRPARPITWAASTWRTCSRRGTTISASSRRASARRATSSTSATRSTTAPGPTCTSTARRSPSSAPTRRR